MARQTTRDHYHDDDADYDRDDEDVDGRDSNDDNDNLGIDSAPYPCLPQCMRSLAVNGKFLNKCKTVGQTFGIFVIQHSPRAKCAATLNEDGVQPLAPVAIGLC